MYYVTFGVTKVKAIVWPWFLAYDKSYVWDIQLRQTIDLSQGACHSWVWTSEEKMSDENWL